MILDIVLLPPDDSLLYAGHYDPLLVGLSVAIAVLASYTSLMVAQFIPSRATLAKRRSWTVVGGISLGGGVWAMHFTGMLAFSLPCTTTYDPTITLMSMVPAMLACILAMHIISRDDASWRTLLSGGLLIGAGIGGMHYAGMAAYRLNGFIRYDLGLFVLSLLVAFVLAVLALWVRFRLQALRQTWRLVAPVAGALVMGSAVSAMHYTAMAAAYFVRGDSPVLEPQLSAGFLAFAVLAVSSSIILITLAATFLSRPGVSSFIGIFRPVAVLILAWAVVAWLGSGYYLDRLGEQGYRQGRSVAEQELSGMSRQVAAALRSLEGIPAMLAREEAVQRALRRFGAQPAEMQLSVEERRHLWSADPALAPLDGFLATVAANLDIDAVWLVNAQGDCIAASNADKPASFVGANFTHRDYFRQAQKGLPGRQYAMGQITGIPGFYRSAPLIDQGSFIGAVVAKRDLPSFIPLLAAGNAFIADANGVVVLAGDKSAEGRVIPGGRFFDQPFEERVRQYGSGRLKLLDIRAWRQAAFPSMVVFEGDPMPRALVSQELPDAGMTVYVARAIPQLAYLEAERPWIFVVAFVAGSMLIIALAALALNMRATRHAKFLAEESVARLQEHRKQLEQVAHYDPLTNLPNRLLLSDRLLLAMAHAVRRKNLLAVMYIDLDGFKAVNDAHGHAVGDQLLAAIAKRMKRAIRDSDTLARLGGDEFVAVLGELPSVEDSAPFFNRILTAASQPFQAGNLTLQVSASVGVTFYPQAEAMDADQLLRQADQAMYQAKLAGKNRCHLFDAEHDRSVKGRHETLEHIRLGLACREFVLHFQPKVNMRQGTVIGAEALIRWQHPERGLLPPAEFMPVIENHALAIEIGEWVIDAALRQMSAWQAAGRDIAVSVNVAGIHLSNEHFSTRLAALLAAHPEVPPERLTLEVLETSALEDIDRISSVMEACQAQGVDFALDDFGTGYSSLTYLKKLPAGQLKMDQSFVRDMLDDPDDLAILEGVLGLSLAFRRQAVAEGVESMEHGRLLLQLGCEIGQGFGIAAPMPAGKFVEWMDAWTPSSSWRTQAALERQDLPVVFAIVEHRAWVAAVEAYLRGDRASPPTLDTSLCRLGHWLSGSGRLRFGQLPAFEGTRQSHLAVHAEAGELITLKDGGEAERALAGLPRLRGARDELVANLESLAEGMAGRP